VTGKLGIRKLGTGKLDIGNLGYQNGELYHVVAKK